MIWSLSHARLDKIDWTARLTSRERSGGVVRGRILGSKSESLLEDSISDRPRWQSVYNVTLARYSLEPAYHRATSVTCQDFVYPNSCEGEDVLSLVQHSMSSFTRWTNSGQKVDNATHVYSIDVPITHRYSAVSGEYFHGHKRVVIAY